MYSQTQIENCGPTCSLLLSLSSLFSVYGVTADRLQHRGPNFRTSSRKHIKVKCAHEVPLPVPSVPSSDLLVENSNFLSLLIPKFFHLADCFDRNG